MTQILVFQQLCGNLRLLVTRLGPSAGTCNSVVAKGTKSRSLCSAIRAKIEISLPIDTERCFWSTWANTAPVHTRGNIRHFWFTPMVGRSSDYSLALHWMVLFSLQKTLTHFSCRSVRLDFPGHISSGLSLFSYGISGLCISGLCNQPSLTFPGPPVALATYKHYKWESTNIWCLVLN